jgi:hypothetical protein
MLRLGIISLTLFSTITLAHAGIIESYRARLSTMDHHNSSGERLTSPAAIIRQDRANFHVFGIMDPEDENDNFFSDKANRARLEKMLSRSAIASEDIQTIINEAPVIRVDIYEDRVEVTIEEY